MENINIDEKKEENKEVDNKKESEKKSKSRSRNKSKKGIKRITKENRDNYFRGRKRFRYIYRSKSRNADRNKKRALNKEDPIFGFRNDQYKEIMEMNEDEKEDEEYGFIFESNKRLKVYKTFDDMKLRDELMKGIYAYGFDKPSSVQQRAIMPIIEGKDIIVQSQAGTGKTCVFAVGALQRIETKIKDTQILILSPTRELAEQSQKVILALGDYMKVTAHCCVGGKSVDEDLKKFNHGTQIISGTPGRVYDMIQRKSFKTKNVKMLVIDEADEMLSRGFKEQVYDIYRYLPVSTQNVVVSATLPEDVLEMTSQFMAEDTVKILVKRSKISLEGIKQFYIDVQKEEHKFATLCDLYDSLTISQAVIFCNEKKTVEWLCSKMRENFFTVSMMHGDLPQKERDKIMQEFRMGETRVLIASDIWGRGLDVQQVSLVINYDLPFNKEMYIHRIGRSGRFGRRGIAINLVKEEQMKQLHDIEKYYSITIEEMPNNINEYL
jgi:ATP-dependent RNA helicase